MNRSVDGLCEFDTSLSFADATPGYWDCYDRKLTDNSIPWVDVEERCSILKQYQYELYNGRKYIGKDGNEHEFILDRELTGDNGIRYASDSITVSYRFYNDCASLIDGARETVKDFESMIRDYVRYTYTIGGEILFPKQRNSLNQARGRHPNIRDRFDLTLVAIKNRYDGMDPDDYVLSYSLSIGDNVRFLDMFRDFNEFCRFFFLDDMLENGEVKLFCPFDGKHPLPKDVNEYLELIDNQRIFVEKRNERIRGYIQGRD